MLIHKNKCLFSKKRIQNQSFKLKPFLLMRMFPTHKLCLCRFDCRNGQWYPTAKEQLRIFQQEVQIDTVIMTICHNFSCEIFWKMTFKLNEKLRLGKLQWDTSRESLNWVTYILVMYINSFFPR